MSVQYTDDGRGNLTVQLTATETNGNVTISGASPNIDENGNVRFFDAATPPVKHALPYLYSADYEMDLLIDSQSRNLVDSDGYTLSLFNPAADFPQHNGIGALADAIECVTDSELNGGYELMMRYPADGQYADGLVNRNIIVAANEKDGDPQPYRIYRVSKPINGIYTVYARHIVQTDLAGIPVKPFHSTNVASAMANLNSHAMIETGFTFSTDKATFASMNIDKPTPLLSVLGGIEGSILDVYGGEYKYDGKSVALLDRVGADNGVRIAYGVNLTNFEQDANIQDCYTGAVGYWSNDEATIYTNIVAADGAFDHVRIATVDLTDKFENKPPMDQLESALRSYVSANGIGVPKVSINLSFVDLSQTTEYSNIIQSVALGDTVHVNFPKIGVDASARVVKTRWNVLLDRYDNIDIGSVKSNIADTIAKQTRQIADTPNRKTTAAIAGAMAQVIMGAAGGSVRLIDTDEDGMPDEFYIADNPDPDLAQKVWRFNYEGWAGSNNGYDGPFTVGATVDGGIMVGGANNSRGKITMYDSQERERGYWASGGISLFKELESGKLLQHIGPNDIQSSFLPTGSDFDHVCVSISSGPSFDGGALGTLIVAETNASGSYTGTNTEIIGGQITCKKLIVNGHEIT